ncbi:hypothetical protein DFH08DRAFT_303296 [Mycena albidolilacea]|uniref:Uncharacterized protein n=1 Tax=Mycena albidolilacea TaxID=1033008 RepID=A0AAD7EKI8_9AGAR|nr:hypothetical protein DFH08DRAFT_303296 [Mycena albidolilacea]
MPKPVPFTPKPAVAKLPLAVRKDIRDNFDSKKEDFQTRIKELLGVDTFTISDAPGLASSPEAPKPKPWLDKPSQAKSLASGGLGLGLGVTEAQAKGSSRGLEGGK